MNLTPTNPKRRTPIDPRTKQTLSLTLAVLYLIPQLAPMALASPSLYARPGAGVSDLPIEVLAFDTPGFGDVQDAVNLATGNVYVDTGSLSRNNVLDPTKAKDEKQNNTIAAGNWNLQSKLRLETASNQPYNGMLLSTTINTPKTIFTGDGSGTLYTPYVIADFNLNTLPSWIKRYRNLKQHNPADPTRDAQEEVDVAFYTSQSTPGVQIPEEFLVYVKTTVRGAPYWVAHLYDHSGNRSTFFNSDDLTNQSYVDFKQNLSQQYRGAQSNDPEGIGASPKTQIDYVINADQAGMISRVRDEWGRLTTFNWAKFQGSGPYVLTSINELVQNQTTPTATWTRQTRFAYDYRGSTDLKQLVVTKVMYIASTGLTVPVPETVESTCGQAATLNGTNVCSDAAFTAGNSFVAGMQARTFEFDYTAQGGHVLIKTLKRPILRKDAGSNQTFEEISYTYDATPATVLPRITQATSNTGDTVKYEYLDTSNGSLAGKALTSSFLLKVTDGPTVTTYTLNGNGQLLQKNVSGIGNWYYKYYPNGYTQAVREPSGVVTYYSYDTRGNLTNTATYPDGGFIAGSGSTQTTTVLNYRYAYLDTNGNINVRDFNGQAISPWYKLSTRTKQVQVTPQRIYLLDQDYRLFATESPINVPIFKEIAKSVANFTAVDQRIAIRSFENVLSTKEGSLDSPWVQQYTPAGNFALSKNRFWYTQTDGKLMAKTGSLSSIPTHIYTGSFEYATSDSLGIVKHGPGYLLANPAVSSTGWNGLTPNFTDFKQVVVDENRIVALRQDGNVWATDNPTTPMVQINYSTASGNPAIPNITQIAAAGNRIGLIDATNNLWMTSGSAVGTKFAVEAQNATQVSLAYQKDVYTQSVGAMTTEVRAGWTKQEVMTYDGDNRAESSKTLSGDDGARNYKPIINTTTYTNHPTVTAGNQSFELLNKVVNSSSEEGITDQLKVFNESTFDTSGRLTQQRVLSGTAYSGATQKTINTFQYYSTGAQWSAAYTNLSAGTAVDSANPTLQYGDQVLISYNGIYRTRYLYNALGYKIYQYDGVNATGSLDYTYYTGKLNKEASGNVTPELFSRETITNYNGFGQSTYSNVNGRSTSSSISLQTSINAYGTSGELLYSWNGKNTNITEYQYETSAAVSSSFGKVKKILMGEGSNGVVSTTGVRKTTEYDYDTYGRVKTESVDGFQTRYEYDTLNRPTKKTWYLTAGSSVSTTPSGDFGTLSYTYTGTGQIATETETISGSRPVGGAYSVPSAVTIHTYDNRGREIRTVFPNGGKVEQVYDDRDQVVQSSNYRLEMNQSSTEAQSTYFRYDSFGRLIKKLSPVLRKDAPSGLSYVDLRRPYMETEYNVFGLAEKVREYIGNDIIDPSVMTTNAYVAGKPDSEWKTITSTYDDYGRLIEMKSPRGYVTKSSFDPAGNIWRAEQEVFKGDEAGADYPYPADKWIRTYQSFDALGRGYQSFDGNGFERRKTYNIFGGVSAEIEPNQNGKLIVRKLYVYGNDGLLKTTYEPSVAETAGDPDAASLTSVRVDATGTSVSNMVATEDRVYGSRVFPVSIKKAHMDNVATSANAAVTSYTYNAAGQPLVETLADNSTVVHAYDSRGLEIYNQNPEKFDTTKNYNVSGLLTEEHQWPRSSTTGASAEAVAIDAEAGFSSTDHPVKVFTYDVAGNVIAEKVNVYTTKKVYNSLGQGIAETRSHNASKVLNPLYRYFVYRLDGIKTAETSFDYQGNITNGASSGFSDTDGNLTTYGLTSDGLTSTETSRGYIQNSDGTKDTRLEEYNSTLRYDGRGLRIKREFSGDGKMYDSLKRDGSTQSSTSKSNYNTVWVYDSNGNLKSKFDISKDIGSVLNRSDYTYNAYNMQDTSSNNVSLKFNYNSINIDRGSLKNKMSSYYNNRSQLKSTSTEDFKNAIDSNKGTLSNNYKFYADGKIVEKTSYSTPYGTSIEYGTQNSIIYDKMGRITQYSDQRRNLDTKKVFYEYSNIKTVSFAQNVSDGKYIYSQCEYPSIGSKTAKSITYDYQPDIRYEGPGGNSLLYKPIQPINLDAMCKGYTSTSYSSYASQDDPLGGTIFEMSNYSYVVNKYKNSELNSQSNYPNLYSSAWSNDPKECQSKCIIEIIKSKNFSENAFQGANEISKSITAKNVYKCTTYYFNLNTCTITTHTPPESASGVVLPRETITTQNHYSANGTKLKVIQVIESELSGTNQSTTKYSSNSRSQLLSNSIDNLRAKTAKRYDADQNATQFYNYQNQDAGCNLIFFCYPSQLTGALNDFVYDSFGNILVASKLQIDITDGVNIKSQQQNIRTYAFANQDVQYTTMQETGRYLSSYCYDAYCIKDATYTLIDSIMDNSDWNPTLPFVAPSKENPLAEYKDPTPSSSVGLTSSSVNAPQSTQNPFTGGTDVAPPQDTITQNATGVMNFSNPLDNQNPENLFSKPEPEPIDPNEYGPPTSLADTNPHAVNATNVQDQSPLNSSGTLGLGDATLPGTELNPNLTGSSGSSGVVAPGAELNPNLGGSGGNAGGNSGSSPEVVSPDQRPPSSEDWMVAAFAGTSSGNTQSYCNGPINNLSDEQAQFMCEMEKELGTTDVDGMVTEALKATAVSKFGLGAMSSVNALMALTEKWDNVASRDYMLMTIMQDIQNGSITAEEFDIMGDGARQNLDRLNSALRKLNSLGHRENGMTNTYEAARNSLIADTMIDLINSRHCAAIACDAMFYISDASYGFAQDFINDGAIFGLAGLLKNGIKAAARGLGLDTAVATGKQAVGAGMRSIARNFAQVVSRGCKLGGNLCKCNSFTPETPVWTKYGLTAIAALAIGTPVLAFNEQTGEQGYYPITQMIVGHDPEITGLVIEDSETGKLDYVVATPEHPFYVTERLDGEPRPKPEGHPDLSDKWVGAGHLKVGDKLKQADGTLGEVRYVNTIQEARTMYNLEVEEAHTFFVGTQGWLVHNGCGGVNLDTGSAVALISEGSTVRGTIKNAIGDQPIYMTQTALAEFENIVAKAGGPLEQARAKALLARVKIIPDNVSPKAAGMKPTRSIGENDIKIFGTADSLGLTTITADAQAIRAAAGQGVEFDTFLHPSVPLTGK
ncbi:DUF1308 domain-containing protein [Deinococcus misasensis]|uniref:DUF1308 domain-containing protein n=1 Tax=Deinococcus misasensis TaxID=392413 RepID=UPI0005586D60|nr:DUF1308 domain-containing protein [Deinococcus misasensis]